MCPSCFKREHMCNHSLGSCVHGSLAGLFFVTYVLIVAVVMMNIVIAVLLVSPATSPSLTPL